MADTVAKVNVNTSIDDESEEHWEDSEDEAWPTSSERYTPIGDANSKVSSFGSSRLAREFTMGNGFYHLTEKGNRTTFDTAALGPCRGKKQSDYYTKDAIALMKHHGLKDLQVRNHTYLRKVLLVTDAPHAIKVYIGNENGPCVVGMALVRDGIIFTSGVLCEKYQEPLVLEVDPECPILDTIEMQSCTWLGANQILCKKITYLKLTSGNNSIVFGEPHISGFDGDRGIYAPVEDAHGKLCISAIGYFDSKPISLQIVDLGSGCQDVVDAMDTNVYYHNGVISGNITRSRKAEVEFLGSITTDQDHVWEVLEGCMDAIEGSSPSHGELLPNAVDLIEEALSGDIEAIHSVLRVDRYLTHIIQQKKTIQTFSSDRSNFYAKLIPLKQMWGILSDTTERIKRINSYQPVLNSFSRAFLEGTNDFFRKACFVFLTQLTLLILTVGHCWTHMDAIFQKPSLLKIVVSVCGTIVVAYLAVGFKANYEDFLKIFPDYADTTLCIIDALSNVGGGIVVTFCTFFLLMMTDNNLDIVLNATALLFVIELDEIVVDNNPIYITGLYRAYFVNAIIKDLDGSDKRYWDYLYLRKNRGEHYRIHLPSCSFLFSSPRKKYDLATM